MNFNFDILLMLKDIVLTSFKVISTMAYIVVPLLILVEILKDCGVMTIVAKKAKGFTQYLNLPGEAAIGIVVGIGVGLVFGSGVIYNLQQDLKMDKIQLNTLFVLVGICHAIFEETAVYLAIGANFWGILLTRVLCGILFTYLYLGLLKLIRRRPVSV